jgi:hypothetical protein
MSNTIEQDIVELDNRIRELKGKYDQFLKGELRKSHELRALDEAENQVQTIIRTQAGRNITNPSLRFRFNNVVARYNSLKPYWARKRREVEEGKVVIPFTTGRKMDPVTDLPPPRPGTPSLGTRPPTPPPSPVDNGPIRPTAPHTVASAILSSGDADGGSMHRLYDAYVGALGPDGASRVPFQAFESQIRTQVDRHLSDGAAGIKFQVVETDGKVRITSKPLRANRSEG